MTKILWVMVVGVISILGRLSLAAEGPAPSADASPSKEKSEDKADSPSKAERPTSDESPHALGVDAHTGCPLCPVSTPEEMDVLMTLRERQADVVAREAVLKRREAALQKLEEELDGRVQKLDAHVAKLEERLELGEPGKAVQEKRIAALVETLSGLTAKKAAPILAAAEPEVAAELLRRVGAAKAAALLAVMPPIKAGEFISLGIDAPPAKRKKPAAAGGTQEAP